jgi:hypothetical protein
VNITAVRKRRLIAILAGFLLVIGVAVVGVVNPPAAHASTCSEMVFDNTVEIKLLHTNCDVSILAEDPSSSVSDQLSAVSPNGSTVAYSSLDHSGDNNYPDYPLDGIYVMNIDGNNAHQLTFPMPCSSGCDEYEDLYPSWNNDGTVLAFERYGSSTGTSQIYSVKADGSSGLTNLSDNSNFEQQPVFSPDGSKIAYTSTEYSGLSGSDIFVMDSDGTDGHVVNLDDGSQAYNPAWSPDGTKIYFTASISGTTGVYVENADGSGEPSLVASVAANSLSVSSSGTIAYSAFVSGEGYQLFTMAADGSDQQQVTDDSGGGEEQPQFVNATWPNSSTKTIVALGDSVPAGEGVNYGFTWNGSGWDQSGPSSPAWNDTTTALGSDYQDCHQSGDGYPSLFATSGGNYQVYNMACTSASALVESGAPGGQANTDGGVMVGQTFSNGDTIPAPQLGSSSSPECSGCGAANSLFDTHLKATSQAVVLLQMGADDIDFGDWILRCYVYGKYTSDCSEGGSDQTTLDNMLTAEKTDLRTTLTELNSRAATDGYSSTNKLKVAVLGYYNPLGSDWNSSCIDEGNGNNEPGIDVANWDFITHGLSELNSNISSEVTYAQTNAGNLNPIYVDLSNVMSNNGFCTSDPWVYGPSIDYPQWAIPPVPGLPAPFHPTPEGQQAIYKAIVDQAGL